MEHVTAGLLGPVEWTSTIAKETSNTSFGVGALKRDEKIATTVYPSKYPEKIWSLLFPLYLSHKIYLNIQKIDRYLGETIIALEMLNKKDGKVHMGELVDREMFNRISKGTVLQGYARMDPDPAAMREELLDLEPHGKGSWTNIVVDQAFNVKGVGCVALGFVLDGVVSKHQELFTCPGGKRTRVRSIQIHDKEYDEASTGARVGIALKNISPEDLPRGASLSPDGSPIEEIDRARVSFRISEHWKDGFSEGDHLHICNHLQFTPAVIRNLSFHEDEKIHYMTSDVILENSIWRGPGDRIGLSYLDSGSFRFLGAGETI
ncbi:MAG: EF-Tu/IF-2/RF-3 family GTPase [Thermoplasmatota archaeon]